MWGTHRCEITGGAGEEQPVNATGLWMAHEDRKVRTCVDSLTLCVVTRQCVRLLKRVCEVQRLALLH